MNPTTTDIMTADMSIIGAIPEMRALDKFFTHSTPPDNAAELIHQVLAEIEAKGKNKEKMAIPIAEEGQDPREPAREGLRQVAVLVESKCSPEEANAFKHWLVNIAKAVAVEDIEGSHFGIGGQRILDIEQAALAELEAILK